MVLLSALVTQRLVLDNRAVARRGLVLASRDLAWAVDRELTSTLRTLSAIAESPALDAGDVRSFSIEARRAAATQTTWLTLLLLTPDGRQLVNTAKPPGAKLPRVNEAESLRQLVSTGEPVVGNLARGRQDGKWAFPVRVPVKRNGKLKFVLTAVITPQFLTSVIRKQARAEGEWTRSVLDSKGVVVARTRDPERYIGRTASPEIVRAIKSPEHVRASSGRIVRSVTLDGVDVYRAMSPVRGWNWTGVVAVPVHVLEVPGQRAVAFLMAVGTVLVLASSAGAYVLARRITLAVSDSAAAAQALTRGEKPVLRPTNLAEIDSMGESLQASFGLLLQRERERDEHLLQAQEARMLAEKAQLLAEAAQKQAEESSRLKDEFLATVSHELRTPLTAIMGWSYMLRAGHVPEDDRPGTLLTIERNARSLSGLVDDLLDASRIINGNLAIEQLPVDMASVVNDAVQTIGIAAETNNVTVSSQVEGGITVCGDRRRLLQIALNLLANAVKFTPGGGHVDVQLHRVDGLVKFTVRDTGEGIDASFLPHMFDRFRQADGSTTRRAGGLGLGLAIVRNLVQLHGGSVYAASAGLGQGSVFTVELPLSVTEGVD